MDAKNAYPELSAGQDFAMTNIPKNVDEIKASVRRILRTNLKAATFDQCKPPSTMSLTRSMKAMRGDG
jgi:hypothetical protein